MVSGLDFGSSSKDTPERSFHTGRSMGSYKGSFKGPFKGIYRDSRRV